MPATLCDRLPGPAYPIWPSDHAGFLERCQQPCVIRRPNWVCRSGHTITRHVTEAIDGALDHAVIAGKTARPDVVDALVEIGDGVRQISDMAAGQPLCATAGVQRRPCVR